MADVDLAASRFRDDSELAALDRAGGAWTSISPRFTELLAVALRAARLTDGDVDPTVGAALSGLGYDRDVEEIPADGVVVAVPAPGWRSIELDEQNCRVRLAPGVRLDLGATAKAWTADTAAGAITAATGSGCLVSIGGDIAVAGTGPAGGWRIRARGRHRRPRRPARRPVRPRHHPGTAAWPPPRSAPAAGSATASGCTTSSTRTPACRRVPRGGRSPRPPAPASTRTCSAPRRWCAATGSGPFSARPGCPSAS